MTKPSWQNYGTYDDSSYPQLWKGVRAYFAPCLGPTGNILIDHNPRRNHGNGSGLILSSAWSSDAITYSGSNYHAVTEFACSREWSVCGWVRHEGGSFGVNLLGGLGRAADGTNDYLLYMSAANTANMWGNQTPGNFTGATTITTTDSFALNTWQHFCWRVLPGSVEFYLQGKYQGVSAGWPGVVRMGQIGARNGAAGWIGKVSDLVFWDRSISPAEISQHYQVGRGGMLKRAGRRLSRYGFKSYPSKPSKASLINVKPSTPSFENGFAPRDGEAENPNLLRGLVGAWCPSLGVTGNTLRDISGNNRHGTLTNMDVATDWVVSDGQYALDFDGVDDYVVAGSLPDFPNDFTLSGWGYVYSGDTGVDAVLVRTTNVFGGAARSGVSFVMRDAFTSATTERIGCEITDGLNRYHIESVAGYARDTWHHILCRRQAGVFSLWINGVQEPNTQNFSGLITNNTDTYIGAVIDYQGGLSTLRRRVDSVAVYNRALSANEIRQLYQLGRGAIYTLKSQKKIVTSPSRSTPKSRASIIVRPPKPNTDNLLKGIVGCWSPSLGVTGNTLRDVSGRNNHGVLTNMDPATDWVSTSVRGVSGRVLDFDGSNDYVNLGRSPISGAMPRTIVIWVKVISHPSTFNRLFYAAGSLASTNGSRFQFGRLAGTTGNWYFNGFNANAAFGPGDLNWHMHALSYDGVTLNWLVDSVSIGASALSLNTHNDIHYIGADVGGVGSNSQIGELVIYNRVLSQSEISSLYSIGNGAIGRALTQQTTRSNFSSKTFPSTWLKVGDEWTEVQPKVATGSQTSIITRPPIEPSYKSGYAPRDGEPLYPNLHKGLVGAWCPSLGVTGGVLRDVSGRNNHGTLTNMNPATDWVLSGGQYALDFDGVDDYIPLSRNVFSGLSVVTVSMWARPRTTTDRVEITQGTDNLNRYGCGFAEDGNAYVVPNFSGSVTGFGYAAWSGFGVTSFLHGVFIYNSRGSVNADRGKIFLNGTQRTMTFVGTLPTTAISQAGTPFIGARPGPATFSNGQADDITVWNRELSPNEIRQLYLLGRGGILTLKQPSLKTTSTIWQPSQPRLYTGDWT